MLPAVRTDEEWQAVVWDEKIVRPAAEELAARLLVSRCDPRLLGRILAAYGRSFDPRALLAYTLLHAQSNLPESLMEFPAPPEPTLDSLALTWFGTA